MKDAGGPRIETRPIPTLGLVLSHGGGEVFVRWEIIEDLAEIASMDRAFGFDGGPYVDPDAARALMAAGLAGKSARGSLYGTDALRALVQHAQEGTETC